MLKIITLFTMLFAVSSVASADFPTPFDEKLDITSKPVTIKLKDNNSITVGTVSPGGSSPKPLRPFNINFSLKDIKNVKEIQYKTNMEMNMGNYEFKFATKVVSDYVLSVTLPKCGSGRTKWFGEISILYKDNSTEKKYVFYDVK